MWMHQGKKETEGMEEGWSWGQGTCLTVQQGASEGSIARGCAGLYGADTSAAHALR